MSTFNFREVSSLFLFFLTKRPIIQEMFTMIHWNWNMTQLIDSVLWHVCHTFELFRYEIREMIQKIKILQGELRAGLYMQEVPNKSPHIARHELNNGRIMSDSSQGLVKNYNLTFISYKSSCCIIWFLNH